MTYPWTAGEVLQASDLNAYAGLVFVKSQDITGTPTSVTITDAFSSQFQNYRIMGVNLDYSTNGDEIELEMGSGGTHTSSYYGVVSRFPYTGSISDTQHNNSAPMSIGFTNQSIGGGTLCVDIFGAYTSGTFTSWAGYAAGLRGMRVNGLYNSSASFTDVTFQTTAGTFVAGTFKVYGYNDG